MYESCFANRNCILLIENVGSVEHISSLTPTSAKHVLVLVTSRKDLQAEAEIDALSIRLGALKPEHSAKLITGWLVYIN